MKAMKVYHLTIQENGHSRRFVYEDRDEALTRFADAIAAGLDTKLDEVVRAPPLPTKPTEWLPDVRWRFGSTAGRACPRPGPPRAPPARLGRDWTRRPRTPRTR